MIVAWRGRPGFTLLEVMVALLIGVMIIASGREMLDTSIEMRERLQTRLTTPGRYQIVRTEIERVIRTARASSSTPFAGDASHVEFEGWCPDAYGGRARCEVELTAAPLTLSERRLGEDSHYVTADSVTGHLDYVVDGSGIGSTVGTWQSSSSTPMAIRWISTASPAAAPDTLMFGILWADE